MFGVECFDTHDVPISHYTQWDINQTLKIVLYGMDDGYMKNAPYVHFANIKRSEALVVRSTLQGDDTVLVDIPNQLLQESYPLLVYVYLNDSSDASSQRTIVKIEIPVHKRARPSDYEYVENIDKITAEVIKQEIYDDLMDEVNGGELKYPQVTFVDGKTGKSVNLKVSGGKIGLYVDSNAYDMLDSRDIVNNLMTNSSTKVLSASMGTTLKNMIDVIPDQIDEKIEEHDSSPTSHSDIRDDISSVSSAVDTMQDSIAEIENKIDDIMLDDTISGSGILTTTDTLVNSSPIEVRIKGETRQNLWVNPSGTSNGVTVTANDDGSFTLSGTASGLSIVQKTSYVLARGKSYRLSIDSKITDDEPSGVSYTEVDVAFYNSSDTWLSSVRIGYGSVLSATFSVPAGTAYSMFRICVKQGDTVSGTYHVMLNEGSTAQPWCPPGLNSVDDGSVDIVTAGKNLVSTSESSASNFQLVNYFLPAGEYTLSIGDMPDGFMFNIRAPRGLGLGTSDDNVLVSVSSSVSTFALDYASPLYINGYSTPATPLQDIQLELGSTATDYEPPTVTTTPIDLDGNTLCSLPDGTHDELTIDATGAVTLTKRTQRVQLDVDGTWTPFEAPFKHYFSLWSDYGGSPSGYSPDGHFVDKLPASSEVANGLYSANENGSAAYLREPTFASDAAGVKEWMSTNKPIAILPLLEPQTISLPPVTLPALPSDKSNIYTASNVPTAGLTVRYWKKGGELVANLYKLLLNHLSQSETS